MIDRKAFRSLSYGLYIISSEKEGKAVVIAPETPIMLSRFEKDKKKLDALYHQGQQECRKLWEAGKIPRKTIREGEK